MDWNNLFQALSLVVAIVTVGAFSAYSNAWISKK